MSGVRMSASRGLRRRSAVRKCRVEARLERREKRRRTVFHSHFTRVEKMSANNVVSIDTLHEDTVGALLLMQRFSFFPTFSFFKLSFCRSIFYAILLFRFTIVSLITTPRGKAHVIALYYLISLCALAWPFLHAMSSFHLGL